MHADWFPGRRRTASVRSRCRSVLDAGEYAEYVFGSMLNCFGFNSSSDIPATPGVELGSREEGELGGDWPYREAVGSLMWLPTITSLDISNVVRIAARHSHTGR